MPAVSVDLDFLQTGQQTWEILVATDAGDLLLSEGGARLNAPDIAIRKDDLEYPALYERFAELTAARAFDADLSPLQLVADAFMRCWVTEAPDFIG